MGSRKYQEQDVINELNRIMQMLGISTLPTIKQIDEFAKFSLNTFYNHGNLAYFSKVMGVPLSGVENGGKSSNCGRAAREIIRPSKAFEKEREARKVGKTYAELQKEQTLKMVGQVAI